jgi:hypothetical protein
VWEKERVRNKEDHAFSNSQNEEGEKKKKRKRKRECATRKITQSQNMTKRTLRIIKKARRKGPY